MSNKVELIRRDDGSLIASFNGQIIPAKHITADWSVGSPLELTLTISGKYVSLMDSLPVRSSAV